MCVCFSAEVWIPCLHIVVPGLPGHQVSRVESDFHHLSIYHRKNNIVYFRIVLFFEQAKPDLNIVVHAVGAPFVA